MINIKTAIIYTKGFCSSESAKKGSIAAGILKNLEIAQEKYLSIRNFYDYKGNDYPDICGIGRKYVKLRFDRITKLKSKTLKKYYSNNNPLFGLLDINPELMIENLDELSYLSSLVTKIKQQANEDYYTFNLILSEKK